MPFVTLPTDREMYYEVEGSGPPLLLTMGTASSHDTWDGQVAAYRHRSIGISYGACGTGQSIQTAYTTRSLADDTAALLRAIDCGSGLPLGSATAQELTINHPDRDRDTVVGQLTDERVHDLPGRLACDSAAFTAGALAPTDRNSPTC